MKKEPGFYWVRLKAVTGSHTGWDVGYVSDDGCRIYITGREDDCMSSIGEWGPCIEPPNTIRTEQQPSIGRIVHFHHINAIIPAIIVVVHDERTVDIVAFGNIGVICMNRASFGDKIGQWFWPPR